MTSKPTIAQFVALYEKAEAERKAKRRAKYAERREHFRAAASNWRSKNPDKIRAYNLGQKAKVKAVREKYDLLVAQLATLQSVK